jgi:hypothetical protein
MHPTRWTDDPRAGCALNLVAIALAIALLLVALKGG